MVHLLIDLIGYKTVLSTCCNSLIGIRIGQSSLGKILCLNKKCLDPILDYIIIPSESIKLLSSEVEKMINRNILEWKGGKITMKTLNHMNNPKVTVNSVINKL